MAIEIKKSVLSQQVQEGWKRKALAEHYGLPETQMAQVLKDAGLQIRKFHAPKYQFVDDTQEQEEGVEEIQTEINEEVGEDVNTLVESVEEEKVTATTTGW